MTDLAHMSHLPFVAASYVMGVGVPVVLAVLAATRLRTARRRLAAVDPRAAGGMGRQ